MELAKSIATAWTAVEESGVPDHMQEPAFREALRSLFGTAAQRDCPGQTGSRTPRSEQTEPSGSNGGVEQQDFASEEDVLQRVSDGTGVAVEKLELVFHIDDGVVKLIGPQAKYGSRTSDQARNVAQIVTVVNKLGMGRPTTFDLIKKACESKHCYDSKNFASQHMPKINGFVVKGTGRSRRLEAKGQGIAAFPDLIEAVIGA